VFTQRYYSKIRFRFPSTLLQVHKSRLTIFYSPQNGGETSNTKIDKQAIRNSIPQRFDIYKPLFTREHNEFSNKFRFSYILLQQIY